jgi:hypothetical protein
MSKPTMDEVVGRVREAVDRGFVSWRWTEDEPIVFDSADLRALLAAFQSVREERDAWKQKATDEESAHALIAGALVGNERAVAQLDRYRVERDQARAALKALSRTGGTE